MPVLQTHQEPKFLQRSRFLCGHLNPNSMFVCLSVCLSNMLVLLSRQEPKFLHRSRFLCGHMNPNSISADGHGDCELQPSLHQLVTRPKYSFDSDDLCTPTR
ncbi:hypothetical protein ElyMa_005616900 [Elysia marginata]|uniref:Uncharacterized protein n=1 Tax=Elysia marginata TaxID=1093978 RepID=A0AAV4F8V7_9GAST|nr:hypothetical protein ElyMa_005616900 [Elysia marginata]